MGTVLRVIALAIALLASSACARPVAVLPPVEARTDATIVIEMPPSGQEVMATTRRWRPSDVVQCKVRLTRWNGTAFVDLPKPLEVVLPQKGTILTQARFSNLAQGQRYRATVTAWGNPGGTAPTMALNTQTPSVAEFDLSSAQDVQDTLWRPMRITLDPAPFVGTAVIVPTGVPSGMTIYDLELAAGTETVYRGTFTRKQTMTLTNLKAGVPYRVTLIAYRPSGQGLAMATASLAWDASAPELEQDVTLSLAF